MSVGDVLNLKKYRVRFRCYVFQYHAFPLLLFFFSIIGLHYKPVPHFSEFFFFFSGSSTSRPAVVREMKPPPHENTLLAAEEDQPRRSDENQASFLSHTRFLDFQGAPDPPLSPPSVEASL